MRTRTAWILGAVAALLAILLALLLPGYLHQRHVAQQAAQAASVTDLGGRPAPDFRLTDQRGQTVSLGSLRGKVVALTFMDPRCTDICPVLASEMTLADHLLGQASGRIALVAVNVNPLHRSLQDLAAFDSAHGLTGVANWYFLTGSAKALQRVWQQYAIYVQVQKGQVLHSTYVYFIDQKGRERYLAGASADKGLREPYAAIIAQYARSLLGK